MTTGGITGPRGLSPVERQPLAILHERIVRAVAHGRIAVDRFGTRPIDVAAEIVLEDPQLASAIALVALTQAIEAVEPTAEGLRRPD